MRSVVFNYNHCRQQGFSIVEMMIALLVGLVLMSGVIDVFLSSRQSSSLQMNLSRIQQNGRLAINTLTADIRMAGYSGCYSDLSDGTENTLNNQTSFAWDLSSTVQGFDNISTSFTISDTASGGVISGILEDTDVLVIRGMADGVPISTNPDSDTFTIASALNRFKTGEILIVADCDQASMFQASSVASSSGVTTIQHATASMTPGNSVASVNNSFSADAEIARLSTMVFYLKNDDSGNPALFQSSLEVNAAGDTASLKEYQLIRNVENMQIQYGVDTDGDQDPDVYQDAATVTDWNNVLSIRIALLLSSSSDFLVDADESYSFDAASFTFSKDDPPTSNANRKLRRSFIGFIALRNRTL